MLPNLSNRKNVKNYSVGVLKKIVDTGFGFIMDMRYDGTISVAFLENETSILYKDCCVFSGSSDEAITVVIMLSTVYKTGSWEVSDFDVGELILAYKRSDEYNDYINTLHKRGVNYSNQLITRLSK